jgi:hypothetical protein
MKDHPQLRHTRWIARTGFTDPVLADQCLRAGFEQVVLKPMHLEQLEDLIGTPGV